MSSSFQALQDISLILFERYHSFHQPDRQHTPYARALYAAMKVSKVNDKFQEALFLALELLRSGTLHSGRIGTKIYSGGPAFAGSEEDKRSMLLVMRVMSIVPLAFHVSLSFASAFDAFLKTICTSSHFNGPARYLENYLCSTPLFERLQDPYASFLNRLPSTYCSAPNLVNRAMITSKSPSLYHFRTIPIRVWESYSRLMVTWFVTWLEGWM